jgi:uncharacterized membrane protein
MTVHPFMLWNLYLAAIPAVAALVLFRRPARIGVAWFAAFGAWLLFLPNAPYVLTDVVHLHEDLQRSQSSSHTYAVLATYAAFFAAGLVSYVVSLQLFRRFLHSAVPKPFVLPALLVVHALCIVAVYLGRFMRLNSWDVVFAPRAVLDSLLRVPRVSSLGVFVVMFVVVGFGTFATYAVGEQLWTRVKRLASR